MPLTQSPSTRRRLRATAATVTALLAVAVAGAGQLSGADGAEARGAPGRPAAVQPVSPVSVPVGLPFGIDVVPVTVTPDPVAAPVAATGPAPAAAPVPGAGDVRGVAEATLAGLPGSAGVTLLLDHPRLGGHLGGVFMGSPGYLLLNARQLAGDPDRTRDVVRHEIAHVYQARLASVLGLAAVDARMVELFGPGGLERSADCVALALGATWTHYTTDCAGPERAAAVQALIAGRLP